MFKTSKNKIVPESTLNGNDPIQARIIENIITINKLKPIKKKEENNNHINLIN